MLGTEDRNSVCSFRKRIINAAIFAAVILFSTPQAETYYIDATNGDDGKDGKSIQNAFKTLAKINSVNLISGDSVLFKSGNSWIGQFNPKGSGSAGNPIVVGRYGAGAKPIIAANGTKAGTVYLFNQKYWEINDLEVTNSSSTPGDFRGIWIAARDYGTLRHIYIKNCYVHDVTGVVKWISGDVADNKPGITFKTGWDASKRTGGIVFETLEPGSKPVATKFDDVMIENCQISDCSFGGIITKQWEGNVSWGTRSSATDNSWVPHSNFTVRNNYMSQLNTDLGCNGIYLTDIKNSLLEGNVVEGAGTSAIELYYADSIIIQSNETFGTIRKAGGADHNGIDPDKGTTNIIVQYNYSHDNGDGILLCQFAFGSVVVRYNILQNNSRYQLYLHSDKGTTAEIYNNTLYNDKHNSKIVYGYGKSLDGTYRLGNNIFVSTKSSAELTTGGGIVYDNNCYFGTNVSATAGDSHKITLNPILVNPGKGVNGSISGPAFSSLEGYKLQESSPVINKGLQKSNNGGRDFWGNVLYNQSPDLGAHEFGTQVSYSITTNAAPGGTIAQIPALSTVSKGTQVQFMATPLDGWEFSGWSGDYSGTNPSYTITSVDSDINLGASFRFTATDSNLYEGENTKQTKGVVENDHSGFSGNGYYNFENTIGSSIEFDVVVSKEGQNSLTIVYANGASGDRPVSISVNGQVVIDSIEFPVTADWDTWAEVKTGIELISGINTITMTALTEPGGPNIDAIRLERKALENNRLVNRKSMPQVIYNPTNQILSISGLKTDCRIELFSINGATLLVQYQKRSGRTQNVFFPMQQIKPGIYLFRIFQNGNSSPCVVPFIHKH